MSVILSTMAGSIAVGLFFVSLNLRSPALLALALFAMLAVWGASYLGVW